MGDIALDLLPDHAPNTVNNFVGLARGEREWTDPRTGQKTSRPLYDGTVFHRVIKDFMIQAGNLKTRGLSREKSLPGDSDEATIKAEIMPEKFVHVRGYIGAAREGDDTNPKKKSSFSQFYIVTGKYYTDMDLDEMEAGRSWKYTPEQREAYKLQGGAAHLDGGYTVFGRLLDGWGTVDKIQRVETDDNNRPLKNVIIKRMRLYTPKK